MAKKKRADSNLIAIKITGPNCILGDRHYLPGETATIAADIAAIWIQQERAVAVAAEVQDDNWSNSQ